MITATLYSTNTIQYILKHYIVRFPLRVRWVLYSIAFDLHQKRDIMRVLTYSLHQRLFCRFFHKGDRKDSSGEHNRWVSS